MHETVEQIDSINSIRWIVSKWFNQIKRVILPLHCLNRQGLLFCASIHFECMAIRLKCNTINNTQIRNEVNITAWIGDKRDEMCMFERYISFYAQTKCLFEWIFCRKSTIQISAFLLSSEEHYEHVGLSVIFYFIHRNDCRSLSFSLSLYFICLIFTPTLISFDET